MSMMLRRTLLMSEPSIGLGEFVAGFVDDITPSSATEWTIQHNLGVVPKLIVVELDSAATLNYYGIWAIYETDVPATIAGHTGFGVVKYHYTSDSYTDFFISDESKIAVNDMSVTLKPGYDSNRSPWDTGATYHVQIYG